MLYLMELYIIAPYSGANWPKNNGVNFLCTCNLSITRAENFLQ